MALRKIGRGLVTLNAGREGNALASTMTSAVGPPQDVAAQLSKHETVLCDAHIVEQLFPAGVAMLNNKTSFLICQVWQTSRRSGARLQGLCFADAFATTGNH